MLSTLSENKSTQFDDISYIQKLHKLTALTAKYFRFMYRSHKIQA